MYTEHKVQQNARKPRAMGMPGIPYVLEYVLEYIVQKVCQEYLVQNFGEYIFMYIKLLCFIIFKTIASQCSSYHKVPHYYHLVGKSKMAVYIHKYDRRSCKHRHFWLKALHRQGSCVKENVMLMPLRSCYFVTDKTLSAKRISLGNYFFHVTTMTYF